MANYKYLIYWCPLGETTIVYENNQYTIISLNNHGHICGVQEYFNERKRKIKINHAFIDPELQWTKAENSTFFSFYDKISDKTILTEKFKKYYTCQHLGKLFAMYCHEISMKIIDGFPIGIF